MASNSTIRVAAKRARARNAGLCVTCCKMRPKAGNATCQTCSDKASIRTIRLRAAARQRVQLRSVIEAHEQAGDLAQEHYLYTTAAEHYKGAVNLPETTSEDKLRLAEKIACVLSLSGDPGNASPWLDQILTHLNNSGNASKSTQTLLRMAWQLWIDSKTEASLPVLRRAIHLSAESGNARLKKMANLTMADMLELLGRFEEAAEFFHAVKLDDGDTITLRISYYWRGAIAAAVLGDADEAYANFERAVQLAKVATDPYQVVSAWNTYAYVAMELGDTNRAKACYEQALLVTRQYQIVWFIPLLCLNYAELLWRMGEYHNAREYVVEALSSAAHAPILEEAFAGVGICLALQIQDADMLAECTRPAAIDLAFQSGQPFRIGSMSTAFAQLYASQGHMHAARSLLHRALKKAHVIFANFDFPVEVARHGALSDVARARILLEKRASLPCADVAQACLALFDAFVEQRRGQTQKARIHAGIAADRFEALQWYGHAEIARAVVPGSKRVERKEPFPYSRPFSRLQPVLTAREQEVAELVLKGLTNREIADALIIAPHTVEKHMNSIMNRLGIRSRYQLEGVLDEPSGL